MLPILVALVAPRCVAAQAHRHDISATVVPTFLEVRDQQVSPVRYRGLIAAFGLEYAYSSPNVMHRVRARYGRAHLTSSVTQRARSGIEISRQDGDEATLTGAHFWRVTRAASVDFFAGPAVITRYSYRFHQYTDRLKEYIGAFYVAGGPALAARWTGRDGTTLVVDADVPVVTYMIHPPYAIKGPLAHDVFLPGDFLTWNGSISVRKPVVDRLALNVSYTLRQYRLRDDHFPAGSVQHEFAAGASIRLGR